MYSKGLPTEVLDIIAGFLGGADHGDTEYRPGGRRRRTTKDLYNLSDEVLYKWERMGHERPRMR